jgi:arginyl-tRNA--protein-N-Asp/Glu arginylyltransferase
MPIPFSYDPEFGAWEFGKLSALREIAFALENDYKYYYMGAGAPFFLFFLE